VYKFPENMHTHPKEGYWKILVDGGLKSKKFLKECISQTGICRGIVGGVGGVQVKNPS